MGYTQFFIVLLLLKITQGYDFVYLTKCCPLNYHVSKSKCIVDVYPSNNFSDVFVTYNEEVMNRSFHENFRLTVYNATFIYDRMLENTTLVPTGDLLSDGEIFEKTNFCIDYLETNETKTYIPKYWVTTENKETNSEYFKIFALLISCVFLTLVLLVYILLPDLRTVRGKIIMSCVGSYLGGFLSLVTMQIRVSLADVNSAFCYSFTSLVYFFFLASFFWMNALAFKLWRDNRQIIKQRVKKYYYQTVRRGGLDNRIYGRYCLYAWGIPLIMTTFLVVADFVDLENDSSFIKPNIIQNGCFLKGKEALLYLYVPMFILIISNWILFLMTACNLWGTFKETSYLAEKAQSLKKRSFVLLKLSILMGISWMLEVIGHLVTNENLAPVWFIFDFYNGFIGVAFFLVLVCKKRVYKKIFQKRMLVWDVLDNWISLKKLMYLRLTLFALIILYI